MGQSWIWRPPTVPRDMRRIQRYPPNRSRLRWREEGLDVLYERARCAHISASNPMGAEEGGSRRGQILPIGHKAGMLERRRCDKRTRYAIAIGGKGPAGGAGVVPPSLPTSRSSWGGQEDLQGRKTAPPLGPRRCCGVATGMSPVTSG
jgi:hypothetical protein